MAHTKRLNAETRRVLAGKAYRLMLARLTYTEIGNELGVSRQLAASLVKEEQRRIRDERGDSETELLVFERGRAVDTFDETIRLAWQKLRDKKLAANSTNQAAHLNAIITAQREIVKIYGLDNLPGAPEGNPLEGLLAKLVSEER